MNRKQAIELVDSMTKNKNLVKHMLAVGACMKSLAKYFNEDQQMWEVAGIVHDGDYDQFAKTDPKKHPSIIFDILKEQKVDTKIIQAVRSHAWGWREDLPQPQSKMDWALYCSDELTGLITAVALTRPSRKIKDVNLTSIKKKWKKKDFAKGVHRKNIEYCETKLNIPLDEFIQICLTAMQEIKEQLDL